MRKSLFLFVALIPLGIILSLFTSCKQCNRSNDDAIAPKKDTVGIPRLDAINEELKKDSLNPFLFFKRAQIYEANGDIQHASKDMFKALTLDSLRSEFFLYTAELFKKSGQPYLGVALMQKAITTDSLNINYYVKAAELAYVDTTMKAHYQIAMNFLNAAIDKNPQNADIYFFKGNVFKEVGDTAKAISSFQTATELNPKYYDAFVQLGLLLQRKKDKNAEKYLDNAIRVNARPEDALYAKANLLKEAGVALYNANKLAPATEKLSNAAETFKKVIDVNHRNVEAYIGVAYCYYQMDSVEEAYHYYDLAIKIEPTYAALYFYKGLCAEELGKKKEAMTLYQNCLNLDDKFKKAEEHLKKLQEVQ